MTPNRRFPTVASRGGLLVLWTWRHSISAYTQVMLEIVNAGGIVSLLVGGAEQSRVNVASPGILEFEYMQQMDVVVQNAFPGRQPLRALHVGAGLCALPWAWEVERPGSRQQAFEVSEEVAMAARTHLPLPRKPLLRIRVADGRDALTKSKAVFQVVVRDAFVGTQVPSHLRTLEWAQLAAERTEGLYLANAGHGRGVSAREDVAAAAKAFASVAVIGSSKVLKSARWGNLVIVGCNDPALLDQVSIERELRKLPLPATMLAGSAVTKWLAGARPLLDPLPTV